MRVAGGGLTLLPLVGGLLKLFGVGGKKQELPIKKLLLGMPLEKVANPDAMSNPGCLKWYSEFAAKRKMA